MDGFMLLCGHLVGDYILQNDWMAKNKVNPNPGRRPVPQDWETVFPCPGNDPALKRAVKFHEEDHHWQVRNIDYKWGHCACFVHCFLYTFSVWIFASRWMPWWGLVVCFLIHFPIDRWRLARKWMFLFGQEAFATGPLSPWSVIIVDNTLHLVTLAVISYFAGRV